LVDIDVDAAEAESGKISKVEADAFLRWVKAAEARA
jgi:hypothetical protein